MIMREERGGGGRALGRVPVLLDSRKQPQARVDPAVRHEAFLPHEVREEGESGRAQGQCVEQAITSPEP